MQSWKMGRMTVRLAIVMLTLVASLALFGCGDDDGGGGQAGAVNTGAVNLTRATGPILNGSTFDFSSGEPFDPALTGDPTSATFQNISAATGAGTATVKSGSSTANANVTVGSLTFVWTSSFPPGQGPQSGGRIVITKVQFQVITTDDVVPGGDEVSGILRLILFTADGRRVVAEVSVRVSIDDTGTLFVNGINTGLSGDDITSGLTGSGS